jgi:hypothetical protein
MEIKIIGKGCYFCDQLRSICGQVAAEMGLARVRIVQVNDLEEMLNFGVVNPPALVVNGKLKLMGRVLLKSRIRRALEEELPAEAQA